MSNISKMVQDRAILTAVD